MNRMKSVRFPVKSVGGLSLIFSRVFVAVDFLAMILVSVSSFYRGFKFFLYQYRLSVVKVSSVSSIVESKSQGIGLSECQSFVVSVYRVSRCQSAL
jgi:hypothetical protein